MKRFVNGDEATLHRTAVEVHDVGDRLMVRTAEGSFSAIAVKHESAILVSFKGRQYRVEEKRSRTHSAASSGSGELRAPMPGMIVDVRHAVGDSVKKGDTVLVLESMKTQQPFLAPFDGEVHQIAVEKGEQVKDGALLAVIHARKQEDV